MKLRKSLRNRTKDKKTDNRIDNYLRYLGSIGEKLNTFLPSQSLGHFFFVQNFPGSSHMLYVYMHLFYNHGVFKEYFYIKLLFNVHISI